MIPENLMNGLVLLCLGMGFVLSFLCILIVSMHIMSKIVGYLNKIFPEVSEVNEKKSSKTSGGDIAAIALALAAAKLNKQ